MADSSFLSGIDFFDGGLNGFDSLEVTIRVRVPAGAETTFKAVTKVGI